MIIGEVIGTVVATTKHELLVGYKILVVQVITPEGNPVEGQQIVAVDTVGAGKGEQVILTAGTNAVKACEAQGVPVDAAIIGIIDEIDVA